MSKQEQTVYCEFCLTHVKGDELDYRFELPICIDCSSKIDRLAEQYAEEVACAHCESVTVTYGGLKNAQNEAFQEGIRFAVKMLGATNIADLDKRGYELYDEPVCTCGGAK